MVDAQHLAPTQAATAVNEDHHDQDGQEAMQEHGQYDRTEGKVDEILNGRWVCCRGGGGVRGGRGLCWRYVVFCAVRCCLGSVVSVGR